MMGDSLRESPSTKRLELRVSTGQKFSKTRLIGSFANGCSQKTLKCITSMKQGVVATGAVHDIGVFLLTTTALEIVRRFSLAKCPVIWHGLQALQLLCYPPFKWIQKWAPFTGLVKKMQTLSRPLLLLSIATGLFDQPKSTKRTFNGSNDAQASSALQSEPSSESLTPNSRSVNKVPRNLVSEKWLVELYKELEKQGIRIPERLDEDELRRFYDVSGGNFSRFLSSVKKTISWRQKFTILSPPELEAWMHLIFWHGSDMMQRPCLIIRIGLACSNLNLNGKSLFARAVVSQIEYGVLNLIDAEHPQLTVLMDCMGLSPFGFPMQTMRSCAVLLQDHYPNRLACLLVIRLPPVARVITRTLFQVLKPMTRQKLRIVGEDYQEVLARYFETLPPFLGGNCSCSKCSDQGLQGMNGESVRMQPSVDLTNILNVPSPGSEHQSDTSLDISGEQIRNAIMGVLMLWIFIAFILGMYYREMLRQYNRSDS